MILGLFAFFLAIICIYLLVYRPMIGVLFIFISKSTIDMSWNYDISGISALQLLGAAVPILVLSNLVLYRTHEFKKVPGNKFWLIFLWANIGGFAVMAGNGDGLAAFESFLRVLNGFAGYHLLHPYIRDERDFKRLLVAFLIAGIAPIAMGLYQAATGHVWSEGRYTVGLLRNIGIYHDAFSLRSYGYITLTGIILYSVYFARSGFTKVILGFYGLAVGGVLFKVYSKAAVVIAGLWVVTWSVMRRRISLLFIVLLAILVIDVVTGNKVVEQVELLFSKETSAIGGTGDSKRVLAGRLYVWEDALTLWADANPLYKIFGIGESGGSAHNDYIRVLLSGGIFSLISYITLLSVMGWKVLQLALSRPSPINVMALMIFIMWIVDTIGLTPGIYPGYQWYVWGFIGVALRGLEQQPNLKGKAYHGV